MKIQIKLLRKWPVYVILWLSEVFPVCVQSELQEILSKVHAKMDVIFSGKLKQVILYGSYARGDSEAFSDIDVMIVVDMDRHALAAYRDEVWDFAEDMACEYNYDIVLSLKLQDEETLLAWGDVLPYYKNVIKEGMTIYG